MKTAIILGSALLAACSDKPQSTASQGTAPAAVSSAPVSNAAADYANGLQSSVGAAKDAAAAANQKIKQEQAEIPKE